MFLESFEDVGKKYKKLPTREEVRPIILECKELTNYNKKLIQQLRLQMKRLGLLSAIKLELVGFEEDLTIDKNGILIEPVHKKPIRNLTEDQLIQKFFQPLLSPLARLIGQRVNGYKRMIKFFTEENDSILMTTPRNVKPLTMLVLVWLTAMGESGEKHSVIFADIAKLLEFISNNHRSFFSTCFGEKSLPLTEKGVERIFTSNIGYSKKKGKSIFAKFASEFYFPSYFLPPVGD
jgi:hypothetical protein